MALMWAIVLTGVLLSVLGLLLRLSTWLEGSLGPLPAGSSKLRKFGYFLGRSVVTFFGGRFWKRIGAVLGNGLVHLRLKKRSTLRWVMHISLLVGFVGLFILSQTTGFFVDFLRPVLHVENKLAEDMANKDTPWFALLNEVLGVVLFIGVLMAMVRRFVLKSKDTLTNGLDKGLVFFLFTIVLTGYLTEAARLVVQGVPAELARYSFVGWPLAELMKDWNLPWTWKQVHVAVWLFHIALSAAFFVYIPFSKMFHVFASPLLTTWQTVFSHEGEHTTQPVMAGKAGKEVYGRHEQGINA